LDLAVSGSTASQAHQEHIGDRLRCWLFAPADAGEPTLGTMPWNVLSKRFSLRSLLIAITLVAVMLGLVVNAMEQ